MPPACGSPSPALISVYPIFLPLSLCPYIFAPSMRTHTSVHTHIHTNTLAYCQHPFSNSLPSALEFTLTGGQDHDRLRWWITCFKGSKGSEGCPGHSYGPLGCSGDVCVVHRGSWLPGPCSSITPPHEALSLATCTPVHQSAVAAHLIASGEGLCPAGALGQLICSPVVRLGKARERRAGTGIISCLAFPNRQAK